MNIEVAIVSLTEKSIKSAINLSKIFDRPTIYIMQKHRTVIEDYYLKNLNLDKNNKILQNFNQENISNSDKKYDLDNLNAKNNIKREDIIYYEKLSRAVDESFKKYDYIIFIMATGIVVRSIASYVKDKTVDPAIIVCDEKLKFAISLLSGHIGGANSLCNYISKSLGTIPVITTATDVNEKGALDNLVYSLGAFENSKRDLYKKVNYKLANDEKVYLISDIKIPENFDLRGFIILDKSLDTDRVKNIVKDDILIHISYRIYTKYQDLENYHKIIPKSTVLGIGCKKNTDIDLMNDIVQNYLKNNNIEPKSIYKIASIDIKKEEKAIKQLAKNFDVDFITFTADEIRNSKYYQDIQENSFVSKITGVNSVSLACTKILSDDNIIAQPYKGNGITIASGGIFKD